MNNPIVFVIHSANDRQFNLNFFLAILELQRSSKRNIILFSIYWPTTQLLFNNNKIELDDHLNIDIFHFKDKTSLDNTLKQFIRKNKPSKIVFCEFNSIIFELLKFEDKSIEYIVYDIHMLGGMIELLEYFGIKHSDNLKQALKPFQNKLKIYYIFPEMKYLYENYGFQEKILFYMPYSLYLPLYQNSKEKIIYDVYSAGNHLRDFNTLKTSLKGMNIKALVRSTNPEYNPVWGKNSNIFIQTPLNYIDFIKETSQAKIVVLTLEVREHMSCGLSFLVHAMALGKPIIVTDCPSSKGYIIEGHTGLLIPPYNPKALKAKIHLLLTKPILASNLSKNTRKFVSKEMDLVKRLKEIIN